jgi:hypothetical protein
VEVKELLLAAGEYAHVVQTGVWLRGDREGSEKRLLSFAIKPRNPSGMFPQLNIVTVDHLFGAFLRVVVVSAVEIHSFDMLAVAVNKICSIVRHKRYFHVRRERAALSHR